MNAATLIVLALKTSIVLTMFGLGLGASLRDATSLFRRPERLLRSLLSMNVIMPLFAVALAGVFALHPAVKIALVALAVSPVPPFLPKKQLKAGGEASYTIGLLVAAAVLAIVFVPLAILLLARVFAIPMRLSPAAVAQLVLGTVLVPLAAGIAVHQVAPAFAERMTKPVALVATVLLVVSALPILFTTGPAIVSLIGNGTLVAFTVFTIVGLAAGHFLGGPEPGDRAVLALSTASRHPGVAAAIASANFPGQKLVLPAILLSLLVGAIVSTPYLAWSRRQRAGIQRTVAMMLGFLMSGLLGGPPAMAQAQTAATDSVDVLSRDERFSGQVLWESGDFDAKDPDTKFPPITPLRPPTGALFWASALRFAGRNSWRSASPSSCAAGRMRGHSVVVATAVDRAARHDPTSIGMPIRM